MAAAGRPAGGLQDDPERLSSLERMAERESIQKHDQGSGRAYRAFLLRCWQEPGAGPGGQPAWRFTLVEMGDRECQKGFARLAELVEHLCKELEECRGAQEKSDLELQDARKFKPG